MVNKSEAIAYLNGILPKASTRHKNGVLEVVVEGVSSDTLSDALKALLPKDVVIKRTDITPDGLIAQPPKQPGTDAVTKIYMEDDLSVVPGHLFLALCSLYDEIDMNYMKPEPKAHKTRINSGRNI